MKKSKKRVKRRVFGTAERPRLSIFRSLKNINVQIIDDEAGKTVFSISNKGLSGKNKKIKNNVESAKLLGTEVGKKCLEKGIKKIVFDRGDYLYHGRVAAVAEGARSAGLAF